VRSVKVQVKCVRFAPAIPPRLFPSLVTKNMLHGMVPPAKAGWRSMQVVNAGEGGGVQARVPARACPWQIAAAEGHRQR